MPDRPQSALVTLPNIPDPDGFYSELIALHDGSGTFRPLQIGQQVDEEQFNHQVEAACKECMLKIEFVSGLV